MRSLQAALLALALGGCAPSLAAPGDHPALEALVSACESPRFDLAFWRAEAERETTLWGIASSFCEEHSEEPLPNCTLVLAVGSAVPEVFVEIPEDLVARELLFRQSSHGEVSP